MKKISRIDAYNYICLVLTLAVFALPNFIFNFSWVYFGIMLAVDIILVVVFFSTRYELTAESLVIKTGPLSFKIDYDRILKISHKKCFFSASCATAVKCIKITFGSNDASDKYSICISPQDETEFLEYLKTKAKNAEID